jgi:hypothetical protein
MEKIPLGGQNFSEVVVPKEEEEVLSTVTLAITMCSTIN